MGKGLPVSAKSMDHGPWVTTSGSVWYLLMFVKPYDRPSADVNLSVLLETSWSMCVNVIYENAL